MFLSAVSLKRIARSTTDARKLLIHDGSAPCSQAEILLISTTFNATSVRDINVRNDLI